MQPQKRKYLVRFSVLLTAFVIGIWIYRTNTSITTSRITIKNPGIPDAFSNFKIAHVSDLHNFDWKNKLIDRLKAEAPDLIAVTGDLIDSPDMDCALEFMRRAAALAPVYYVTGNHEAALKQYGALAQKLAALGVHIMDDQSTLLEKDGAKINLVGIRDPRFDNAQPSAVAAKLKALSNPDAFNLVLCHRPELFDVYTAVGSDLVFTGHAHGGQIRIPPIGGLIAPDQGFFPKYTAGVYHRDRTDMVVSRGLGNSIIPVRINNTPELVILTLTNGS